MEPLNPKEKAFQRRGSDILRAAFSLFAEFGIESTTMDMIAEKASVGKGTIYKHFTKKNDIFATLVIQQGEAIIDSLNDIDPSAPTLSRIKQMIRIFWESHTRDMQTFEVGRKCRQLLILDDLSPRFRQAFERVTQAQKNFARDLFQRAIDEEIFRRTDVNNMIIASMGLYAGMLDAAMEDNIRPTEELYQVLKNMIFRGFMA